MFKAVPLVLVNIQVAQEEISHATAVLTRLRIMHLINLVETPLGKLGYMGELERDLLNRYQQVGDEVDRWAQALEIPPQVVEIPADLDPAKDIYPLEETMDRLRGQVGPLAPERAGSGGPADQAAGIPAEPGIIGPRGAGTRNPGRSPVGVSNPGMAAQGKSPPAGAGPGTYASRPDPPGPGGDPDPGPGGGAGHGPGDFGPGLEGGLLRAALPAAGGHRHPERNPGGLEKTARGPGNLAAAAAISSSPGCGTRSARNWCASATAST